MGTDNIIFLEEMNDEIPEVDEFDLCEISEEKSELSVAREKVPRLDKQKILKAEEDKSLKERTIENMAKKYDVNLETINKKVSKYKQFAKMRDDLMEEATSDFIKTAILQKKQDDEDNLVKDIISSIIEGVLKDIKDDKLLETMNKNNIYKSKYLEYAKKEILDCITEWKRCYEEKDFNGIQKIQNSKIFNNFIETYEIRILEPDVMSYQSMFYGDSGEEKFIKLISIFFGNKKEAEKIKKLSKDIKKFNLRMDDVFAL